MALKYICRSNNILETFKYSKFSFNFLTKSSSINVQFSIILDRLHHRNFTKIPGAPGVPKDPHAPEPKKRKPLTSPPILLILPEGRVTTMTLEEAEKLSVRRNLKLVNVLDYDTKTKKPLYKLMTMLEFFEEEAKNKKQMKKERNSMIKDEKLFVMTTKIGEIDLCTKIKQMKSKLNKRHCVRVDVSFSGDPLKADEILTMIDNELKEVGVKSKEIKKKTTIKVFYNPIIETTEEEEKENTNKEEIESTSNEKPVEIKESNT